MKSLKIALDYDDTFTADPVLWSSFVKHAQQLGHTVFCITARRDTLENQTELENIFNYWNCPVQIFFCNLNGKQKEMDNKGIRVDIWIDDSPFAITEGY